MYKKNSSRPSSILLLKRLITIKVNAENGIISRSNYAPDHPQTYDSMA